MAEGSFCKHCGTKLDPKDRFCPECGSPVLSKPPYVAEPQPVSAPTPAPAPAPAPAVSVERPTPPVTRRADEKFCTQCGANIPINAEICPMCRARQAPFHRAVLIERRDWILVTILSIITLGVYYVYWIVSTKRELVAMGADIPTAWFLIIPIANFYFMWKYAHGVEYISDRAINGAVLFLLWIVFFPAAIYMTQTELNRHVTTY